jgi:hypothetical protein
MNMNMSRGYIKPETIKILVCSGNLGNAQPDQDSMEAWIPRDGYCRHVLESKYPVSSASTSTGPDASGSPASEGTTGPPAPRPFEKSLNLLLKEARQTQQEIQAGKHHSSKPQSKRMSVSMSNDDLIAACIIQEDGVPEDGEGYGFEAAPSLVNNEQFDIIVIGMQESTFDVRVSMNINTNASASPSASAFAQTSIPSTNGDESKTNGSIGAQYLKSPKDLLMPLLPAVKAALGVSKPAVKAVLGVSKPAVKAAKGVSKVTVKAAKGSAKTVTKVAKGSATIVSKAAKDSAKTVSNYTTAMDHTLTTNNTKGGNSDTHVLHDLLQEQLPSYSQAVSYQRGEMRLIVLYQQDSIDLDVLSVKAQNTGRAGLANKGGIVSEVAINQTTRLAFLTTHLEAHEGQAKYATRCSTIADIFKGTESSASSLRCDASISSHFMFVTGDLNFRTRLPDFKPGSPEHVEVTHQLAYANDYATLGKYDELSHALKNKDCLVGFQTPVCNFPPTFKVLRQDGYKYMDNRSPSYTDRILYLGADQLEEKIQVLGYEPIDNFTTSDHKPIRGAFEVELNQKLKWRPVLANRCVQY